MISTEVAKELDVAGLLPKQLSNVSFTDGTNLWKKEKHFSGFKNNELSAQKYQYFKAGKILGFETKRYLSQWQGHLFYFNV